jgi:hypothetical protein
LSVDTFLKVNEGLSTTAKLEKIRHVSNFLCPLFAVEKWTVIRGLYKLVGALTLPTTFGGLTQAGGSLPVLRAINFHLRTTLSAELHPRLRQTARYLLPIWHC